MWFSPQKELDNGRFLPIVLFSGFVHCLMICSFFLVDYFGLMTAGSTMSSKPAARVSMAGSAGSHAKIGTPLLQASQPVVAERQMETQKEASKKIDTPKVKEEKKAESPKPVVAPQQKKEVFAAVSQLKKPQIAKETAKDPDFSQLKKEYTVLKREKSSPSSKKEKDIKKLESTEKKVDAKVETKETKSEKSAIVKQDSTVQKVSSQGGVSGGTGISKELGKHDTIEFDVAEAAWSPDEVVREIYRHYTLPPGFEDHDAFTVSFDIENFKVVNISPHGSEPLVLYAAIKEALLRCTMPRKNAKNKILTIT